MDYQKSKRQKRILGEGKGIKKTEPASRPVDQPGERPMAQQRVNSKKPSWYNGNSKATATVKQDNTRRQFENAFGSKATGGVKSRNSNTGNVTEQSNKPSWYSGKKTKAKATVRGKNG